VVVSPEVPKLAVASKEMLEGVTRPILELMGMQVFPVEGLVAPKLILVVPWVVVSPEAPKLVVASKEMQEEVVMPLQVLLQKLRLEGANHLGVGRILAMVHRARNYR
jgi:hypothetical protein